MTKVNRITLALIFSTSIVTLSGCKTLQTSMESMQDGITGKLTSSRDTHERTASIDIDGAMVTLRSAGFTENDFGSLAAMRSAASMLAAFGAEWHDFDTWSGEILEEKTNLIKKVKKTDEVRKDLYLHYRIGSGSRITNLGVLDSHEFTKEEEDIIRKNMIPVSCFDESGNVRSESSFADLEVRRQAGGVAAPNTALYTWSTENTKAGRRLTWSEYAETQVEKYPDMYPSIRSNALKEYSDSCAIYTPTAHAHYILNVHFKDVFGSLYASVIDRVGSRAANNMAINAMRQQVGQMNSISSALWETSWSGQWAAPENARPAYIGSAEGILPRHLGGMCSPFGEKPNSNSDDDIIGMDEIASALGFESQHNDRGWHCLTWSDYNWEQVSDMLVTESKLFRQFMKQYPIFSSNYKVPYWAYPGPHQSARYNSSQFSSQKYNTTHKQGACADYAVSNSGLKGIFTSWSYPACETLDSLNKAFDKREEVMVAAGRRDAFMCSDGVANYSRYDNADLSQCPVVYPRSLLEMGNHK